MRFNVQCAYPTAFLETVAVVALVTQPGEGFDTVVGVAQLVPHFRKQGLAGGAVAGLERVLAIKHLDAALVLSGVVAMDRPQAQGQRAVLMHRIAAQVPTVQVAGKAFGIQVAVGFGAHHADAPSVVQRPVGAEQHALNTVFQASAAALFVEAAVVAQALHPEVAVVVGGQGAQG